MQKILPKKLSSNFYSKSLKIKVQLLLKPGFIRLEEILQLIGCAKTLKVENFLLMKYLISKLKKKIFCNCIYSDKDAVVLKLKERLFKLYGKDNGWHLVGTQEETTIYFGTADYLKLMIEESDNVENIIISCTENGKLSISDRSIISSPSKYIETVKQGTSITITGNEYQEIYGKENGMRIDWFLSENMINAFKAAPETPLSSASDIITVTINFVDGTSKTFAIELNFDDEGMLTSIYKA